LSFFVCVVELELHLPRNRSLKEKRKDLKSLKDRLQRRFGATVAETDHHELWQRATLTAALVGSEPGPLRERRYDDHFVGLDGPTTFALEGGGRRIELQLRQNYPFAQVYAPLDFQREPYVCFEPMTAPVNALVSGESLTFVAPEGSFRAAFSVRVQPTA